MGVFAGETAIHTIANIFLDEMERRYVGSAIKFSMKFKRNLIPQSQLMVKCSVRCYEQVKQIIVNQYKFGGNQSMRNSALK